MFMARTLLQNMMRGPNYDTEINVGGSAFVEGGLIGASDVHRQREWAQGVGKKIVEHKGHWYMEK